MSWNWNQTLPKNKLHGQTHKHTDTRTAQGSGYRQKELQSGLLSTIIILNIIHLDSDLKNIYNIYETQRKLRSRTEQHFWKLEYSVPICDIEKLAFVLGTIIIMARIKTSPFNNTC